MPYIDPLELERIKQIDLLSYLQKYEPDELIRCGINAYRMKTHSSLKLSNGKWYWWAQSFGGKNALDFLIRVREMSFIDAAQMLGAGEINITPRPIQNAQAEKEKELKLPKQAQSNNEAKSYLISRCIDKQIIECCVKKGLIYGSKMRGRDIVVFVGKDREEQPKYGAIRSTSSNFKGEVGGSDKRFSFRLESDFSKESLHAFEDAIDLLSYATLAAENGKGWQRLNLLSLGGIPPPSKCGQDRLPLSLKQYLKDNPNTERVHLHFDNDNAGKSAANTIASLLEGRGIKALISPPPKGKDVNEYLAVCRKEHRQTKEPNGKKIQEKER